MTNPWHDPATHAAKIRDGAIKNAKRILEAYGYEVHHKPWRCSCGARYEHRASLHAHITVRSKVDWVVPVEHRNITPTGDPEL